MGRSLSVVRRAVAVAAATVAAVAGLATPATAAPTPFTPIVTMGQEMFLATFLDCLGYIDVRAATDGPLPEPNYITFTPYLVGLQGTCVAGGEIRWRNLDTGASGSKVWAAGGFGVPRSVSIDTGPGRVSVDISTTRPHIASHRFFVAS